MDPITPPSSPPPPPPLSPQPPPYEFRPLMNYNPRLQHDNEDEEEEEEQQRGGRGRPPSDGRTLIPGNYNASFLECFGDPNLVVLNSLKATQCIFCTAHNMPKDKNPRKLEEALILLRHSVKEAWNLFQRCKPQCEGFYDGVTKLYVLKRHLLHHVIVQNSQLENDEICKQMLMDLSTESAQLRQFMMRTVKVHGKPMKLINRAVASQLNINRRMMLDNMKIISNNRHRRNVTTTHTTITTCPSSSSSSSSSYMMMIDNNNHHHAAAAASSSSTDPRTRALLALEQSTGSNHMQIP